MISVIGFSNDPNIAQLTGLVNGIHPNLSTVTAHYPTKGDHISDKPEEDAGNNFGRVARSKILDDYIKEVMSERLLGIPLVDWQKFLKRF